MIHVLATIELAPACREEFLKGFNAIVPTVREEAGCLEYGPAIDIPSGIGVQQMLGENAVMVIEKWTTLDALRAHLAAPHMSAWREQSARWVKQVSLRILQPQ